MVFLDDILEAGKDVAEQQLGELLQQLGQEGGSHQDSGWCNGNQDFHSVDSVDMEQHTVLFSLLGINNSEDEIFQSK